MGVLRLEVIGPVSAFYTGSKNWIPTAVRLAWQLFPQAESSPCIQHIIFYEDYYTSAALRSLEKKKKKPLQFDFNYNEKVTVALKSIVTFGKITCCILVFQLNKVIKNW